MNFSKNRNKRKSKIRKSAAEWQKVVVEGKETIDDEKRGDEFVKGFFKKKKVGFYRIFRIIYIILISSRSGNYRSKNRTYHQKNVLHYNNR